MNFHFMRSCQESWFDVLLVIVIGSVLCFATYLIADNMERDFALQSIECEEECYCETSTANELIGSMAQEIETHYLHRFFSSIQPISLFKLIIKLPIDGMQVLLE